MFVPRSVLARKPKATSKPTPEPTKLVRNASHEPMDTSVPEGDLGGKGKERADNPTPPEKTANLAADVDRRQELATLVELSVTDYAIWNSKKILNSLRSSERGWITLKELCQPSPLLHRLGASETAIFQALKNINPDLLEFRLVLSNPVKDEDAIYEVRKPKWDSLDEISRLVPITSEQWDSKTIYVENIPQVYTKTYYELMHFLQAVLSKLDDSVCVQGISFPPREGWNVDDTKCRGFAFVILETEVSAQKAAETWSWDGMRARFAHAIASAKDDGEAIDPSMALAAKCGFRSLSMSRWKELKEEYLRYCQAIIALNEPPKQTIDFHDDTMDYQLDYEEDERQVSQQDYQVQKDYPKGCVVFIRNVHPETSKTTIKKLISKALNPKTMTGREVDYVDYEKGLDACYVRLSSREVANRLVKHFSDILITQFNALDENGVATEHSKSDKKPLVIQLLEGEREALYWGNVPSHIRLSASEKYHSQHGEDGARLNPNSRRKKH